MKRIDVGRMWILASRRLRGSWARAWKRWTPRRTSDRLGLGQDPWGIAYELDYSTGLVGAVGGLTAMSAVVPFAQAHRAWAESVLILGGYATLRDEDGDLTVSTEAGTVYLDRDDRAGVIRFTSLLLGAFDVESEAASDLINRANADARFGRWYFGREGCLIMEGDLVVRAGVTAAQLLAAIRAFTHQRCLTAARIRADTNADE